MKTLILNDAFSVIRARLEIEGSRFSISNLVQSLQHSGNLQLWIFDGPNNSKSRKEVYPAYKGNRKPAREDIYQGLQMTKEIMKLAGLTVIEVPNYEADDVIFTLTRRYKGVLPMVIMTRDYDLRALCSVNDNIFCSVPPKPDIPDNMIALYKLWVGDKSDNIPGVYKFGEGAWAAAKIEDLIDMTEAAISGKEIPLRDSIPQRHQQWITENREEWLKMLHCLTFKEVPADTIDQHTHSQPEDYAGWKKLIQEFES